VSTLVRSMTFIRGLSYLEQTSNFHIIYYIRKRKKMRLISLPRPLQAQASHLYQNVNKKSLMYWDMRYQNWTWTNSRFVHILKKRFQCRRPSGITTVTLRRLCFKCDCGNFLKGHTRVQFCLIVRQHCRWKVEVIVIKSNFYCQNVCYVHI